MLKVTFKTAGRDREIIIECGADTSCKQLRKLIESQLDRDMSNMSLYNADNHSKLSNDDIAPTNVLGVKTKNESAS